MSVTRLTDSDHCNTVITSASSSVLKKNKGHLKIPQWSSWGHSAVCVHGFFHQSLLIFDFGSSSKCWVKTFSAYSWCDPGRLPSQVNVLFLKARLWLPFPPHSPRSSLPQLSPSLPFEGAGWQNGTAACTARTWQLPPLRPRVAGRHREAHRRGGGPETAGGAPQRQRRWKWAQAQQWPGGGKISPLYLRGHPSSPGVHPSGGHGHLLQQSEGLSVKVLEHEPKCEWVRDVPAVLKAEWRVTI